MGEQMREAGAHLRVRGQAEAALMRQQMLEAREAARAAVKAASARAKQGAKQAREAVREAVAATDDALAEARKQRRERTRRLMWAALKQRTQGKRIPAQLSPELRHHGRRMARLYRIRALAEVEGKEEVLERTDKLIEREAARHQRKRDQILGGRPAAPAARPAAPAQPEAAAAPAAAKKEAK
jgi:translation initiation factor IF-2